MTVAGASGFRSTADGPRLSRTRRRCLRKLRRVRRVHDLGGRLSAPQGARQCRRAARRAAGAPVRRRRHRLVRTEHMFFASERLPHGGDDMAAPLVRRASGAGRDAVAARHESWNGAARCAPSSSAQARSAGPLKTYRGALAKLLPSSARLPRPVKAMDGLPVTIRTSIRRPRVPAEAEHLIAESQCARGRGASRRGERNAQAGSPAQGRDVARARRRAARVQPDARTSRLPSGHVSETPRCRCARSSKRRATPEHRASRRAGDHDPLVCHVNELRDQAALVRRIAGRRWHAGARVEYLVGTMIEVRARRSRPPRSPKKRSSSPSAQRFTRWRSASRATTRRSS